MDQKGKSFEFSSYQIRSDFKSIDFYYKTILENKKELVFKETLTWPEKISKDVPKDLLDRIIFNLHIILGISYWKLYCPKKIIISSGVLSYEQAEFWNTVYTKGLGEFFYQNKIDFRNLINFPYQKYIQIKSINFPRSSRALIPFGGGKDSLLTVELLKKEKYSVTASFLETQRPDTLINNLFKKIDIDCLIVKRQIDEKIIENKLSKIYSGHIPISAIYAFVNLMTAIIYDYQYVIISNERSANIGNVKFLDQEINHQWSKSEEFEILFQAYVKRFITPGVKYFSILRPFSEIKIVELFSHYPQYFPYFSSCNKNFSITKKPLNKNKWCGQCPKCAFVFLLLGVFLTKKELIKIFGKNLLNDRLLIPLYKDLLGFGIIKPFDCVGTFEETQIGFYLISQKEDFKSDLIVKMFESEILAKLTNITQTVKDVFTIKTTKTIPGIFEKILL